MKTKTLISLFFVLQSINLIIAQKPQSIQQKFKCSTNGDFKSDALLKERDDLFDALHKRFVNVPLKEYTGYDASRASNGVWTNGLCRINPLMKEFCAECIGKTIPYLKKSCPKQNQGVAWTVLSHVACMVRYADYRFFPKLEMSNWVIFASAPNGTATSVAVLEKGFNSFANNLKKSIAVEGDNSTKYMDGGIFSYGPNAPTLHMSMQCVPDINKDECTQCLSAAVKEMNNCCLQKRTRDGTVLSASCHFRYSLDNFLDPPKNSSKRAISLTSP